MSVSVICLLVLVIALLLPPRAWSGQEHYDLGGPCEDQPWWNSREIRNAMKAGDWERVITLRKLEVRAGCNNQYRWYGLVDALVKAQRPTDASSVLQEMYSRGFDINPALLDTRFSEVVKFMRSKEFGASSLGLMIAGLEKISDERRSKFLKVLNSMPVSEKPPRNYVAKHVCPFECCQYGNWTVLEDTKLFASPANSRVVGTARKGSRTVALTGEVHLSPEPVIVLVGSELPTDQIAFVLDYGGEGYGHVYTHGKIISLFLAYAEYCFRPSESCWGETLLPATEIKKQVWWVKVRLENGVIGWTDKTQHFDGKDACA